MADNPSSRPADGAKPEYFDRRDGEKRDQTNANQQQPKKDPNQDMASKLTRYGKEEPPERA